MTEDEAFEHLQMTQDYADRKIGGITAAPGAYSPFAKTAQQNDWRHPHAPLSLPYHVHMLVRPKP